MASGAAKTIHIVEGGREIPAKLFNDGDYDRLLTRKGIECLENEAGEQIYGYSGLEHNGKYKRGPPIATGDTGGKRKFEVVLYEKLQAIEEKQEELIASIAPEKKPTPSATELGSKGLVGAKQDGFIETPSELPVLTEAEQKECEAHTKTAKEKGLTAYMTPFLERIFENRCVVNSEDFPWIGQPVLANKLKPDFFVGAHPGVYKHREPPKTKNELVQKFRESHHNARFGPCYWELRDSVFIGECKTIVRDDGIGEFLNKQGHLDMKERMRGFIFDTQECWLIESIAMKITNYKRVPWTAKGSLQAIRNFFEWNESWHAVNELCAELKVEIVVGEPYLGMGARGRVFRVRDAAGNLHALKAVQAKHEWLVQAEHARLCEASCPLLVRPTSTLCNIGGLFGYTMQPIGRSVRSLWDPSLIPDAIRSLRDLHLYGFVHGDPRLENLLKVDSSYVWADVMDARVVVSLADRLQLRNDMNILVKSILVKVPESLKTLMDEYQPDKETLVQTLIASVESVAKSRSVVVPSGTVDILDEH